MVSGGSGLFGFFSPLPVVRGVLPTACAPLLIRAPLAPADVLLVLFLFRFYGCFFKPKISFTTPIAQFL